jgi:DivIVA domain-containing protein
MSATELDLPVLASPDQIRRREFVTARRGYDPQQVRDFLARIAEQVERMQAMLREARMDADAANRSEGEPRPDAYQRLAARFADTLRSADEQAGKIRAEAEREAAKTLEEARAEAERIQTDAQEKSEALRTAAETALHEAKQQTASAISSLTSRRAALVDELGRMRARLVAAADELGSVLEATGTSTTTEDVTATAAAHPPEAASQAPELPGDHAEGSSGVEIRYEDLWEGTEPLPLDLPEIPPLDLNWDDLEED